MIRAAGPYADLTFHALSFVPVPAGAPPLVHAASLHRPAWIHAARERLPADAVEPIARDAPLVGALAAGAPIALALQRFALLHPTIAAFLATARRALAELGPEDVLRPDDLAEMKAAPAAPLEIFRAGLALAARAFASAHASALEPFGARVLEALAPRWEALTAQLPALSSIDLRLSPTLGPRGRLIEDTVLVGTATLPWDGGPPDTDAPLALAAHEASVRAAAAVLREQGRPAPWALVERVALDGAARAYRGTPVEEPHAAWRRGLDERALAPRDPTTHALAAETERRLRA